MTRLKLSLVGAPIRSVCAALLLVVLWPLPTFGETHTVELSLDEGTWISLDVAPSGEVLVFELLGDLYTIPAEGGDATAVVSGRPFESQPRFAPDGDHIAFVSDASGSDNVWIAAADGSDARQVSDFARAIVMSPEWSSDGASIFATVIEDGKPRAAEIWQFDPEAGDSSSGRRLVESAPGPPALLVSSPAPGAYGPRVTPDRGGIVYTRVTPRPYGSRDGGKATLERFDFETGEIGAVATDYPVAMKPTLTPDGGFLVYATVSLGKTGLRSRELATGVESWLAHPIQRHQLEGRSTRDVLPNYSVTRDGRYLYAAYGGKIRRHGLWDGAVAEVPFRATARLELTETLDFQTRLDDGPVRARRLLQVSGAKDGRLAFTALARVYSIDREGGFTRLTNTEHPRELFPSYSPDGESIAFATWGPEGGHLHRVATGGNAEPLRITSQPALWIDTVWSPDGSAIYALRSDRAATVGARGLPDRRELVAVPLEKGGTEPFTTVAPANGLRSPHFGDDGRAYLSEAGRGVVALDRDGRTLVAQLATPERGMSFRRAPSGERIAALTGGRLLLWRDLSSSAEPVTLETDAAEVVATGGVTSFAFSADGDELVWTRGARVGRLAFGSSGGPSEEALSVEVGRPTSAGVAVLSGATLISMRGNEVIDDAVVVIEGRRIVAVGKRDEVTVPEGARSFDLAGKYIVPGFIDLHAHFPLPEDLPQAESTAAFANLALGVTTVRNPQASPAVFDMADLIEADGAPGTRVLSTGPGLAFGRVFGAHYAGRSHDSLDAVRDALSTYRHDYRTNNIKSYLFGNRQQRQWVIEASRELELLPTTEGGADLKGNLTHAIDGFAGNEHGFPVAPIYDDVIQLVAATKMTYTPTLVVSFGAALPIYRLLAERRPHENVRVDRWYPEGALYSQSSTRVLWFPTEDYNDREVARGALEILEAGGRVGLGGHGEVQGLSNHWEMELLEGGGMTPHQVLRVATLAGAEALGLARDLGSIEVGKIADLVVLERSPLTDIRATQEIDLVAKDGVIYDALTLDEVWPRQRPARKPWWLERKEQSELSRIDSRVRQTMLEERAPGLALAVVRGEDVLLTRGYGTSQLEVGAPVTDRTIFQAGSIGKQFTAAGIMALVEDGELELDASVLSYLEEGPSKWQPITVRHLLTHTSGIPDYTGDDFHYTRDYSDEELVEMASRLELEFPAGARWNYSNTGYVLLGIITTRTSGERYDAYLRKRIFDPAGMPTVRVNTEPDVVRNRARGYIPGEDGFTNAGWVAPTLNSTADGSMLLSVHDLIAWNRTVRSRAVLSTASWDEILRPVTLNSGNSYPYGFGWFFEERAGGRVEEHSGAWQGFVAQFTRFVDKDLAVIVLTNGRSGAASRVANEVATILDPSLAPRQVSSEPIDDPDPAAAAVVAAMLEKAAQGALELSDFAFVRQTIFPRMKAFLARQLEGLGAPDRMELLSRTVLGDDAVLVYRVHFGERSFRVNASLGPNLGLTGLRVAEE